MVNNSKAKSQDQINLRLEFEFKFRITPELSPHFQKRRNSEKCALRKTNFKDWDPGKGRK